MYIKICGITNLNDALKCAELGADAIGFNFFSKSKRYISPDNAMRIALQLPNIIKVGLFVNADKTFIDKVDQQSKLDLIQFHGDESAEFCEQWSGRYIRALRIKNETDLAQLELYPTAKMIIIDAAVKGEYGGTGQLADWKLAKEAQKSKVDILLAGGLNADNVAEAIRKVNPFGVDVAGGVEITPGKKDLTKLAKFISNARVK